MGAPSATHLSELQTALEFAENLKNATDWTILPEWPFRYLNAASFYEKEGIPYAWPFGPIPTLGELDSAIRMESHPTFLRHYQESQEMEDRMLVFLAVSIPYCHEILSINGGQLFEFQDSKIRQLTDRECQTNYDLESKRFLINESISRRKDYDEPMTVVSLRHHNILEPLGVLYDTESNLRKLIREDAQYLSIIISEETIGRRQYGVPKNVMLVEELEGYFFKRVAVGCIRIDHQVEDLTGPTTYRYIRLV